MQLITTKCMIKVHYDSSFDTDEGADGEGGLMTCMFVGSNQGRKYGA